MKYIILFLLYLPIVCTSQEFDDTIYDDMGYKTAVALTQEADQYLKENSLDLAILTYKKALLYSGTNAKAHFGLGVAYDQLGKTKEAIRELESSLIFSKGLISAYFLLGKIYEQIGELNLALQCYLKAFMIDSHFSSYTFKGINDEKEVPTSRRLEELQKLQTALENRNLQNKTIYVEHEGDINTLILFSRFLNILKDTGATLLFKAPEGMQQTFQASFNLHLLPPLTLEDSIEADFKIDLSALPILFNTTLTSIPSPSGYLRPFPGAAEKYKGWVSAKPLRIGIAYLAKEAGVSLPLSQLRLFKDLPNTQFYLLQSTIDKQALLELAREIDIQELTDSFDTLDDLTSAICELDLIITVDNSIAYLAGALGKPTYLLLPPNPSVLWFERGSQSFWFSQVKLFRQIQDDRFDILLNQIKDEIKNKLVE